MEILVANEITTADVVAAVLLGLVGGAVGGLLGVGGGVLFVPALALFLGASQIEAEATSLLAIVPVAMLGSWRQHRHGNLRTREALLLGALAMPGVAAGVVIANAVPERTLEIGFACLLLFVSYRLAQRALAAGEADG
ncbi:MAG: sulfite exporter TauE/SafE family protein [Solirubrobacterales bacterium]